MKPIEFQLFGLSTACLCLRFDSILIVYLFLEFEPQLGKSEKINNQGIKENKAFRIPCITKKQGIQSLHRIFLKPQYKVYRGASIFYCNASFSDVPSFFKNVSTPRLEPRNGIKQCCLPPPLSFKNRLKANINIIHLTLINTNLIQQKEQSSLLNKV